MFRVVADQLKLRGGLVRCGSCRHVFDAISSLAYVDDSAIVQPVPAAAGVKPPVADKRSESASAPAAPEPRRRNADRALSETGVPTLIITDLPGPALEPAPTQGESGGGSVQAPAAPAADAEAEQSERGARQERRRQRRRPAEARQDEEAAEPLTTMEASEEPEAEFLQSKRKGRGFSVVFGGGSLLLGLLVLVQLAVLFRVELTAQYPELRPTLARLCQPFGCSVGWPTRADLLAVVGSELQAVPGTDILELTAVVRNRAAFPVALPAIEVTLTDTQNRTLARKVFAPVDYLSSSGQPSSRIDEGLAAGADYEVRIQFEARGISAAGFVVYPFYL